MEKKLLKLAAASVLVAVIPVRLNAKFIHSFSYMCENKNIYRFIGISNGNFEIFENNSKTLCALEYKFGFYKKNLFGGRIFLGLRYTIGPEVSLAAKANTNENINNENSNFLKRGFYTTSKILASLWSIWGAWNNINAGFNYFGNEILGDINIDFEGVL